MFAAEHMDERRKAFMKAPDFSQLREKSEKRREDQRKTQRQDQFLKRRYLLSPCEQVAEDFPAILRSVDKGGDSDLLAAATGLRKMLANARNPPIQQVVDFGLVPALLVWMQRTDLPKLQYQACWAVINIAAGSHDHVIALISKGIIPVTYTLLKSGKEKVREHAVWLIGNLAGDSAQVRDTLLQSGSLPKLLACIQQSSAGTPADSYPWAVSNLCRGKPKPEFQSTCCAVPYLCSVVKSNDRPDILQGVLWALSHICKDKNERVQMLLDEGVLPKITECLSSSDETVQFPALRIIGNIAAGRENQTATILSLVPCLRSLLYSPIRAFQKEVTWIFSNIASGPPVHLNSLLSADVFPVLIDLLPRASEEIQKEILWTLGNASLSGCEEAAIHLSHIGVFAGLTHILEQGSPSLIYAALDVMKALLEVGQRQKSRQGINEFCSLIEECGGLDQLESLQYQGNQQIYEKALGLLNAYFDEEEGLDSVFQGLIVGE